MIEFLKWDSDFFGFRVGRLIHKISPLSYSSPDDMLSYDLVYLFSEVPLNGMESNLMDEKVTYEMAGDIAATTENRNGFIIVPVNMLSDELEQLAYESGQWSRFFIDQRIQTEKAKELYRLWITNSLNGSIADLVLGCYDTQGIILGFITLKHLNDYISIGLIAVDSAIRGKGIGRLLVNSAKKMAAERGVTKIEVVTQKKNEQACAFYEKAGFSVKKVEYIYHIWKH